MANMSAAEVLKAEMAGLVPVKKSASSLQSTPTPVVPPKQMPENDDATPPPAIVAALEEDEDTDVPGLDTAPPSVVSTDVIAQRVPLDGTDESPTPEGAVQGSPHGVKRTHEEAEEEDAAIDAEESLEIEDDDDTPPEVEADTSVSYALKVNADGTVEQEDTVK